MYDYVFVFNFEIVRVKFSYDVIRLLCMEIILEYSLKTVVWFNHISLNHN